MRERKQNKFYTGSDVIPKSILTLDIPVHHVTKSNFVQDKACFVYWSIQLVICFLRT